MKTLHICVTSDVLIIITKVSDAVLTLEILLFSDRHIQTETATNLLTYRRLCRLLRLAGNLNSSNYLLFECVGGFHLIQSEKRNEIPKISLFVFMAEKCAQERKVFFQTRR